MQRRIEEAEMRYRDADRERESLKRQLETTRMDLPTVRIFLIYCMNAFCIFLGGTNSYARIGPLSGAIVREGGGNS